MIYGRKHELLFQFEMPPLSHPLHTALLHGCCELCCSLFSLPRDTFIQIFGHSQSLFAIILLNLSCYFPSRDDKKR